MLILDGGTWVYGIWFVQQPDGSTWHCTIHRRGDVWMMDSQFRGHDSGAEDLATHREFEGEDPLPVLLQTMDQVIATFESDGAKCDFVKLECVGDDPKVKFELAMRPWTGIRMVKKKNWKGSP